MLTPAYICLFVADLSKSTAFYTQQLGMQPIPELTTAHFVAFKFGDCVLGLEPGGVNAGKEKPKNENPVILQFKVASLDELATESVRLQQAGAEVLESQRQLGFGTITSFLDPDGNRLELVFLS